MTPLYIPFSAKRAHRGFTLLELLVALAILGLLTSLGAELLHLGSRSWNKSVRMTANVSTVEAVQSLLRKELSRTEPFTIRNNDGFAVAFAGSSDSLSFFAPLPAAYEQRGPVEIQLFIEKNGKNGKSLVMAWRGHTDSPWARSVLITTITDARFDYFGWGETGGLSWQNTWVNRKELPQAIKLEVDFPVNGDFVWPEFIVEPVIEATAISIYNLDNTH